MGTIALLHKLKEPMDGDGDDGPDGSDWVEVVCCRCTIHFSVTEEFNERRHDQHDTFYCPVGHGNHYPDPNQPAPKISWWKKLFT